MAKIEYPQIDGKALDLTFKQALFLEYYFKDADQNAMIAAKMAGYKGDNNSLKSVGWQILNKPKVRLLLQSWASQNISPDGVISRMAEIANGSMGDFIAFSSDGAASFDLNKAREAGKLHLIKKLEIREDGVRVELHDPQVALFSLAKIFGLYSDRGRMALLVENILRLLPDEYRASVRAALEGDAGGPGSPKAIGPGERDLRGGEERIPGEVLAGPG